MCGGLATASALWLLSGLGTAVPRGWSTGLLLLAAIATVLRDIRVLNFALPQPLRQVPRTIFTNGLLSAAFQFGVELGTGVRTYITSTLPYLLALTIVLTHPAYLQAAIAGIGFGVGRAAMPISRLISHDGAAWDSRMRAAERWLVPASSLLGLAAVILIALHTQ